MSTIQDTTAVPTGPWSLDPVHSNIGFAIKHSGVMTFRGDFADYSASLTEGTLDGSAKVASVRVDDPNLTTHLQSPDFFDAERHPVLRFVSRSIEREGDTVSISGDLTLRGETQPVELSGAISGPITDGYGNERLGLEVETTVNRRDYGINWGADLPSGDPMLADDVTITASLALVRA
jgi:polyisoprenoid-binding protein YceI